MSPWALTSPSRAPVSLPHQWKQRHLHYHRVVARFIQDFCGVMRQPGAKSGYPGAVGWPDPHGPSSLRCSLLAGLPLPQLPPGALRNSVQDAPAGQAGDPRERRGERAYNPAGRTPPCAQPVAAERSHPTGLSHTAQCGWRATPAAAQGEPKPEKGLSGRQTRGLRAPAVSQARARC